MLQQAMAVVLVTDILWEHWWRKGYTGGGIGDET